LDVGPHTTVMGQALIRRASPAVIKGAGGRRYDTLILL
jgi:hypothetical protein